MLILTIRPDIQVFMRQQTEVYSLSLARVQRLYIVVNIFRKEGLQWTLFQKVKISHGMKESFLFNDCIKMFFLRHSMGAESVAMGFDAPLDVDIMRSNCKHVDHKRNFFKEDPSLPVCEYQL